jgi:SAM-dependent methyltransferase
MDYQDLKQTIISYSSRDLEQRKNWYSPAAEAYNKARPCYPQELIRQVVEIAQLSSNSKILEVGCGPATATVAFAQLGFSMVCLEPNPDFYQLAQQNCQQYSNFISLGFSYCSKIFNINKNLLDKSRRQIRNLLINFYEITAS